jgi:hypothetical protein
MEPPSPKAGVPAHPGCDPGRQAANSLYALFPLDCLEHAIATLEGGDLCLCHHLDEGKATDASTK